LWTLTRSSFIHSFIRTHRQQKTSINQSKIAIMGIKGLAKLLSDEAPDVSASYCLLLMMMMMMLLWCVDVAAFF
jgi:hypothetical protein